MTIGHVDEARPVKLDGPDLSGVTRKVLVGPLQGWTDHVMRVFELAPGGYTPKHSHEWFHVNYVLSGRGTLFLDGQQNDLQAGSFAFVPSGREHRFRNTGEEPFVFICIVPEPGDPCCGNSGGTK